MDQAFAILFQRWECGLPGELMSPLSLQMSTYTHPVNRLERCSTMSIATFSSAIPPTSAPSWRVQGAGEENPIVVPDVNCSDFDEFLAILYPT